MPAGRRTGGDGPQGVAHDGARAAGRHGLQPAGDGQDRRGCQQPDRNAQFEHINARAGEHLAAEQPVISIDCKKELVGPYDNGGVEYQPQGKPERVNVHDFVDPELGRAIPYGIYDEANNEGWVSVGDTADTATFAVNAIRSWWRTWAPSGSLMPPSC